MVITNPAVSLTDEREGLYEEVRDLVDQQLHPDERVQDRDRVLSGVWERLADHGLTGLIIPEEYNGLNADRMTSAMVFEEIARKDLAVAVSLAAHTLATACIAKFGPSDVCEEWLREMADGDPVGAFCLAEPDAGTNPAGMTTTVTRRGDEYALTGEKQWVTNGNWAGVYVVFAKADWGSDAGITQFLVPADYEGVMVSECKETLGVRASELVRITFDDVRLPRRYRLTEPGEGLSAALQILIEGRIASAAQSVGLARAAFEAAREYAEKSERSGKRLAEVQTVRHRLADMATRIRAASLLVRAAALGGDVGASDRTVASIAKYFASETAVDVANDAIQIHGTDGTLQAFDVERLYRDAKATTIYEGTSEIQKTIIAREILS